MDGRGAGGMNPMQVHGEWVQAPPPSVQQGAVSYADMTSVVYSDVSTQPTFAPVG
eukprot:CAMPEP_0115886474 /NCGR_PEP_ID=MMETSP0287-20121206/31229_1 /TAXON_ID=412157 /ORGANISM="Chrysochromulina rotalis, Strain UIO044" /LENGTH=54 /DNA_ID=CAMNT_0003342965 /DNA_START=17 /DNA_END=181 /DNA_ORIENTATION=-